MTSVLLREDNEGFTTGVLEPLLLSGSPSTSSSTSASPSFQSIVVNNDQQPRTLLVQQISSSTIAVSLSDEPTDGSGLSTAAWRAFCGCFSRRSSSSSKTSKTRNRLASVDNKSIAISQVGRPTGFSPFSLLCSKIYSMGTAISSSSSPEPEETTPTIERLLQMLQERPVKMPQMIVVKNVLGNESVEGKLRCFEVGIVHALCELLAELGSVESHRSGSAERKRRQNRRASTAANHRGVGYGSGSTRSRWDIERTVEENLAREENLTFVLNALNAFIYKSMPEFPCKRTPTEYGYFTPAVTREIGESVIIELLEYHLKNDSVFDVSEHLELYQSLMETAASMATVPSLVPYLVRPHNPEAKSISKELVPKFRETMQSYQTKWKDSMGSPDFRLISFIERIDVYSEVVLIAAREYESGLPENERIRTATRPRATQSEISLSRRANEVEDIRQELQADISLLYGKSLKHLQMQNYRFIGDYGKLVVPFTFKKEMRSMNPYSPHLRERTKRITKELASMTNALPLNASNSIFVCVDEGRCDIIKVLISGPDDTPYANGLFEFDVFFPTSYPFSPPKCAFLTTGAGNVRFNPNLYNDGKICLSILGTWEGRPEEKWTPYCSLMQVLVSIQGLIFVKDPYFNEPGFEKYQGTAKGDDYSRKYNLQIEHATLTYAIKDQLKNPPEHFRQVIQRHFWFKRHAIIEQAKKWMAEARRDEAEVDPKKKKDGFFEHIHNPYSQERNIQMLINDLTNMPCPVEPYV